MIMLHSTHDFMSESGWDIASFMYKSAVVSIPLFFMVSGYLLIGRSNTGYVYVLKKIGRILRYVAISIFSYWLLYSIVKVSFSIEKLFSIFYESFIAVGPFYVFWYFAAIMLIYLLLPIINHIFNRNSSIFIGITLLLLVVQDMAFLHNLTIGGDESVPAFLRIYNWLTYFLLGGMIRHFIKLRKMAWIGIMMIVINFIFQEITLPVINTTYCSFFYSSLPVVVYVIAIFARIRYCHFSNDNILIKSLSNLFLPVFTIHPFFIGYFSNLFGEIQYVAPILVWLSVSVCAIAVSWLILKIPYTKNLLKI